MGSSNGDAHPGDDATEVQAAPGLLSISQVARRTGLTTTTLRVWQRRYGLGASATSAGGHRRYSPADLARLRAARELIEQGLPTAEAARIVLTPADQGRALSE